MSLDLATEATLEELSGWNESGPAATVMALAEADAAEKGGGHGYGYGYGNPTSLRLIR